MRIYLDNHINLKDRRGEPSIKDTDSIRWDLKKSQDRHKRRTGDKKYGHYLSTVLRGPF